MPTSLALKCLSCSAAKLLGFGDMTGWNKFSVLRKFELRYTHMTSQVANVLVCSSVYSGFGPQSAAQQASTAQGTDIQGMETCQVVNNSLRLGYTYMTSQAGAKWRNWRANHLPFRRCIRVCSKGHVWTTPSQRFADSHIHRQTAQSWLKHTYIPAEFYHTYRHCKIIIRNSILLMLHTNKEFSCHVLYSDINSSRSINRSQEQRSSIVQPSSLTSHATLFASNSPAKKHLIHFNKMAEKGSAAHLITVYRAERQRRVRPQPRRGQIKLKIAHIVVHSIASALLRTFSQLQVLDQKWMWQIVKLVSSVDCSLCNMFIGKTAVCRGCSSLCM